MEEEERRRYLVRDEIVQSLELADHSDGVNKVTHNYRIQKACVTEATAMPCGQAWSSLLSSSLIS